MGQQSPRVLSTDPNAGEPLRTSGGAPRVLSTDPAAGEPLRVGARRGWLDQPTIDDFPVVNLLKGGWNVVKEIPAGLVSLAADLPPRLDTDGSVHYPLERTLTGLVNAHVNTGTQAVEALRGGDYITAARKGMNTLVPALGPVLDASDDKIMRGQIAEGIGEVGTNVLLTAAGMRPKSAPVVASRAAVVPRNAAEAAAVEFARREGIPLDAATATGSQFLRNLQKKVGSTWGGASTAEAAQAAQGDALAAAADRLARQANNNGPAVTGVEAGEGVRSALQNRVSQFHGQANNAYSYLRDAESRAPEELVQVRPPRAPAASHVTPEQSFLLRWMAKDLEDHQFQPSSRMRGARAIDEWQQRGYGDADTTYAPRVAGTPVQDMFHAMGVKGSRPEIAVKIEKFLSGQNKDPRFARLADVLKEAFDGERFDFDLVSDDALTALGIRRRDLKSPIGTPDYAEAGAASFFPDSEYVIPSAPQAAAAGDTAMRFAIDLRASKEAMRPVLQQLQKEREITGVLHGDKAKAALAIEGLVNGPDYAPLSTVDAALGPIKKLASADIPQLRSRGQGLMSKLVSELDTAVRQRASAAGGDVAQALNEGRTATRSKYATAEVMKRIAPNSREPRAIFEGLTRNKDAALTKLRDLQKQAPNEVPNVARALLEDIFDLPTATGGFKNADGAWARWQKLGPGSKRILFPEADHVKALDHFFLLAKKIGENPNPSGTAAIPRLSFAEAIAAIPAYGLAKLLYTPRGVRMLTRSMEIGVSTRPAAQTAAIAQLTKAAEHAGVTLQFPKAADKDDAHDKWSKH